MHSLPSLLHPAIISHYITPIYSDHKSIARINDPQQAFPSYQTSYMSSLYQSTLADRAVIRNNRLLETKRQPYQALPAPTLVVLRHVARQLRLQRHLFFLCLGLFKASRCQGVVDMRGQGTHDVTTSTASGKWNLGLPPAQCLT
jgi:hypothetical protein